MEELEFLTGRYSIRNFDPLFKIEDEKILSIIESAATAPSSNNFQPWKVYAVKNKAKQKVLKELTYGQQQVEDASVVFLVFGDKEAYNTEELLRNRVDQGLLAPSQVESQKERIERYFSSHPEDKDAEGIKLDVGLFSMNLMHVVRAHGYDSVPMRGANFKQIMEYLSIPTSLIPVLMIPVGKAVGKGQEKIRKAVNDFSEIID
ncbi:nitroreductase family protein [Enterococcus sp. AZ072]|uniref:nitroreductase family protein n=1 Tax=unclassified Enterococcus TaxID=2608891 RepID=UPI003D2D8C9B